ncbi:hypothetical protein IP91_04895 [Pseudoduganella lurida]|uniref:Uncharacterized protein n=1 Tax=Pseudoduganella lurida TaxID=1036180 RepID=A0A562QXJ6_9BURK|nr:hypothetical protein [Pseudoduganella lurida]TWI60930.1 hypothetical protein IP91_04895 [Pseudoduganella lurida]
MKTFIASLLALCSATAFSAEPALLEDALSCKLKDNQVASLMRELATRQPAFAKPATQYGAPAADVYQLNKPASALGYSSAEIVVTPGRILLAVPAESVAKAIAKLKLEEDSYGPASRLVRPTVSIVAFQLTHKSLQNKLLVGCEYASADAAAWIGQ